MLDAISDNILAHVAYLDRDFNIVHVNATYAQGSGYRAEELVGRNHFDLFPNEENQRIFERVRDTGEPYIARAKPFEYGNQPERGTTYWDWWLRPIRSPEGRQVMVLSLVDVTPPSGRRSVERLNAELRAADQRKDEFLAMLGHELRNLWRRCSTQPDSCNCRKPPILPAAGRWRRSRARPSTWPSSSMTCSMSRE